MERGQASVSMGWGRALVLGLSAVLLFGCAGRHVVTGHVVYPASVSLQEFQSVVLLRGHLNEDVWLAHEIAEQLSHQQPIRIVPQSEWASLLSEVGERMLAVRLALSLRESTEPRWASTPEPACGPLGCYTRLGSRLMHIPQVRGVLTLTFVDPSGRESIPRVEMMAELEGSDPLSLRREVVQQLAARAATVMSDRWVPVRVVLLDVEAVPEVRRAIQAADAGDWETGRVMLERVVRNSLQMLPPDQQARLLYDLSWMRRLSSPRDGSVDDTLDDAERLLRRAIRLDPDPRYEAAIRELRRHRDRIELARQRRAEQTSPETTSQVQVPEVPEAYRQAEFPE